VAGVALVGSTVRRKKPENVRDAVYQRIRAGLMAGDYRPGETIRLQATAETLGVSITPVHEALRRLAVEGGVVIAPNRSAAVPRLSPAKLRELRALRVMLEGRAVEIAAAKIDDNGIGALRAIQVVIEAARQGGDYRKLLAHNREFHFKIYETADDRTLLGFISSLWLMTGPTQSLLYSQGVRFASRSNRHHEALIDALTMRSSPLARKAITQDIAEATDFLVARLEAEPEDRY
jgi:DNA-binding GntR family transcriptional regulator